MTNSEAIKQLKFLKKVDFHVDTKESCDIAISALEENTKLKAEIEQLKAELEKSVKLPLTNADKIRFMSDEELAEFLSENTNCDCCNIQCVDKLNYPSMSSCLFRFKEWLQSEV